MRSEKHSCKTFFFLLFSQKVFTVKMVNCGTTVYACDTYSTCANQTFVFLLIHVQKTQMHLPELLVSATYLVMEHNIDYIFKCYNPRKGLLQFCGGNEYTGK